jgi:hypothetical protein
MKLSVGLNVISHRGADPCGVPRSPRQTYRQDRKERQADGTTRNPEHRLPWGFLFVAVKAIEERSARLDFLLDLLASAHHFPTPGHGWKGVVGSDHSRPRALLPARPGRLRHSPPSYLCVHKLPHRFQTGTKNLQNKRRAWRWREARADSPKWQYHLTNICFEIGPLPLFAPIFPDHSSCADELGANEARLWKG